MAFLNKRKIWILVLAALLLAALISIMLSTWGLTVSRYQIQSDEIIRPFRVVQLSDLHNSEFGQDNRRLVQKVAAESPDLILVTGDLLTQTEPKMDISLTLLKQLVSIAPTYVSFGNHEEGYNARYGADCAAAFAATGAVVLEYHWVDISVNGQPLRLGGIYGYCLAEKYLETGEARPDELEFMKDFLNTDRYTILMAHMPISWLRSGGLTEWDADCVFSGHLHGGQIRLPFIGGVAAPDMGWFPGKVAGQYSAGGNSLILSRGLGTSVPVPRMNNIPEIVVVDFIPAQA